MARLSNKEREDIKLDIQQENIMLTRVRRYVQYGGLVFMVAVLMLMTFLRNASQGWRIFTIVIAVISGLFTLFSYLAYRRGRKHVLSNINYLDAHK